MLIEFCLPVYNESKILKQNVLKLLDFCQNQNFNFTWVIIIIENGSTDNTAEICKKITAAHQRIKMVSVTEKGKGVAIKKYFSKSVADYLIYMDIDLAVSLDYLPKLIAPLLNNEADLVIGSRLLPDSDTERGFLRSLSSKFYNLLSRIILGHNLSDLQCGFKGIKKTKFLVIANNILDDGWFFDTELIAYAIKNSFSIKEIPVGWKENRYEERTSHINLFSDGLIFLRNLFRLRSRLKSAKLK